MKLVGSTTEHKVRDELVALQSEFSEHLRGHDVLHLLRASFGEDVGFFVLNFFPDGGDDFLELLVNKNVVIELDVPTTTDGEVAIFKQTPLKSYLVGKSRMQQIKLAVVFDLLKM